MHLFLQVMSTRNRERVAKDGLEAVVKMTRDFEGDLEMAQATTGNSLSTLNFYSYPIFLLKSLVMIIKIEQ